MQNLEKAMLVCGLGGVAKCSLSQAAQGTQRLDRDGLARTAQTSLTRRLDNEESVDEIDPR